MTKNMSAAVAAAAAKASQPKPSEDRLKYLRAKVAEARDLILEISQTEEKLAELRRQLLDVQSNELTALFDEVGMTTLTLSESGNVPGFVATLTTQINAALPQDDRRDKALKKFRWLGELSRNTFTVQLGKEDQKKAKKLETMLKKAKVPFTKEVKVHGSTLTAEIRRRYRDGQPLPPADLDLLGAFVRPMVKIEKVKENK